MKLATYNIHYGVGLDGCLDLRRVVDALGDADVIALQEVDVGWKRSGNSNQPELIAEMLPDYEFGWGPTVDVRMSVNALAPARRRRQFGNMILSRYPILSIRNYLFDKYNCAEFLEMQRGALEVTISTPIGILRIYSTHLCNLSERQRIRQLQNLLGVHNTASREGPIISGEHADPSWSAEDQLPIMPANAVILGDMNFAPSSAAYEEIVGEFSSKYGYLAQRDGFVDAWALANGTKVGFDIAAGATTSSYSGEARRIDYCFVSAELAPLVLKADVNLNAVGSDHFPLIVTLNCGDPRGVLPAPGTGEVIHR